MARPLSSPGGTDDPSVASATGPAVLGCRADGPSSNDVSCGSGAKESYQKAVVDRYHVGNEDLEHEGNSFGGDALQLHQFQSAFLWRVALDLDK